jgi:FixJ family two-component response regulator
MATDEFTVYIVDDDASVRDALGLLLGLRGYRTAIFSSAENFLTAYRPEWVGCLLLDIRMPGMDGLTLQKRLREAGGRMPAIVITAHGDVGAARAAFRSHAIDFLEKPVAEDKLLAAIDEAAATQDAARRDSGRRESFRKMLGRLTAREREVMELVVAGRHNREIADALGISARTVEVHKARMMAKLEVDSLAALVRMSVESSAGEPGG